ncbi:MAG: CbrC family protein [Bradymonadaceae bacterium]|nr:CbrC family protein [Lujinxingiaceae bacterium]
MTYDARRPVTAQLLQYLQFVWDYHFIGTKAWLLEADLETFRFEEFDDLYACEYLSEDGKLWHFELDAAALRDLVRGESNELEVRERERDRGESLVSLEGVASFVADLVESGELAFEEPEDEDAVVGGFEELFDDLHDWLRGIRVLTERAEQRDAVAELVDWFLERPEVEDLYMADIELYWLLRRRLWDIPKAGPELGLMDVIALLEEAQAEADDDQDELPPKAAAKPAARPAPSRAALAGLKFELFQAPIDEASSYVGAGFCIIKQTEMAHVFELGIGDYVRQTCSACKTENYLDARDAREIDCRSCAAKVPFPPFPGPSVTVSYEALVDGDAAMTKDTEFGMIAWEQALAGLTHGEPELETDQVETVELEDGWIGAKLDPKDMWQLLQTPTYVSWQGEVWLFNLGRPMAFVGNWSRADFNAQAEGANGKALFEQIVEDLPPFDIWDRFDPGGELCVYVFKCRESGLLRANWDMA